MTRTADFRFFDAAHPFFKGAKRAKHFRRRALLHSERIVPRPRDMLQALDRSLAQLPLVPSNDRNRLELRKPSLLQRSLLPLRLERHFSNANDFASQLMHFLQQPALLSLFGRQHT